MNEYGYGLWPLVIINSFIFIVFAFSFTKPKSSRDWRSFGAFSAFIVALFTEMYGFPLTIYLFSGWLQSKMPGLDIWTHNSGHILEDLIGWKSDPHLGPFHIASDILIIAGFVIVSKAWKVLYAAQQSGSLAKDGIYAKLRHPQYVGFIAVLLGFLLQWPTVLTVIMFPVLVIMYMYLSHKEDEESHGRFGREWESYKAKTPGFIPKF